MKNFHKKFCFPFYIERDDQEIELTAQVVIYPGDKKIVYGSPDNWQPGSDPEMDYDMFLNGALWNGQLTQNEEETLKEQAFDSYEDRMSDYDDFAYDYERENPREFDDFYDCYD
jgi:hypothetical protein